MSTQPVSLSEKYCPLKIADFIGLVKPKRILNKLAKELAAHPHSRALLFEGKSGSGKSAMARAFAAEIPAQVHLLPAHECSNDNVGRVWLNCHVNPGPNYRMHSILVDQADRLSEKQQTHLLSYIEGPKSPEHVVWVFTSAPNNQLDSELLSNLLQLKFSTYGNSTEAAELLELVWQIEAPTATPPNFTRVVKNSNGDLRAALMEIELKLLLS